MSCYESGLTNQLAAAADISTRAILELRLAAYFARKGQTTLARERIDGIRRKFSSSADPCVFASINFAEAICEFFDGGVEPAVQKLRRSKALAIGCPQDSELRSEVSAWMAGFMRILRRWKDFERELFFLMQSRDGLSQPVAARVDLVVADSFQDIADYSRADEWYSRVRESALACGDDSILGASLYNRAAIRVYNLRLSAVRGSFSDLSGCRIELEAATAQNYSQYVNDLGMNGAFELLQGQLALMSGRLTQASDLLTQTSVVELVEGWPLVDLVRRADLLLIDRLVSRRSIAQLVQESKEIYDSLLMSNSSGDVAISAHTVSQVLLNVDDKLALTLLELSRESLEKHKLDQVQQANVLIELGL